MYAKRAGGRDFGIPGRRDGGRPSRAYLRRFLSAKGLVLMTSMRTFSTATAAACCVLFLLTAHSADAGYVVVPGAGSGTVNVKVASIKERHFRTTVRQQYDFSCGSAVLATLLTFHYEFPVSEQEVFKEMYTKGDKDKINREGFSLLDIKKYLERHGYKADGFRITLDELKKLGVPAIVLITHNGFRHFVVVKGVSGKDVLVGDPTFGSRVIDRPEFEKMWNKIIFLVRNRKDVAVKHFNTKEEWHVREEAPLATASTLGQPINILSLHLSEHLGL